MVTINIQKKDLWLLSAIMVFLVGVGYVIAFGSGDPTTMGHDSGEIQGVCLTNGTNCPALGVSSPACTFCRSCGGDWPFHQGIFVDYNNIARYRGNLCTGELNQWGDLNNPALCCK